MGDLIHRSEHGGSDDSDKNPSIDGCSILLSDIIDSKGKTGSIFLKSLHGRPPQHTVRTPCISQRAAQNADVYAGFLYIIRRTDQLLGCPCRDLRDRTGSIGTDTAFICFADYLTWSFIRPLKVMEFMG